MERTVGTEPTTKDWKSLIFPVKLCSQNINASEWIRTINLSVISQVLYPVELPRLNMECRTGLEPVSVNSQFTMIPLHYRHKYWKRGELHPLTSYRYFLVKNLLAELILSPVIDLVEPSSTTVS
jgi:hypothetical protein